MIRSDSEPFRAVTVLQALMGTNIQGCSSLIKSGFSLLHPDKCTGRLGPQVMVPTPWEFVAQVKRLLLDPSAVNLSPHVGPADNEGPTMLLYKSKGMQFC